MQKELVDLMIGAPLKLNGFSFKKNSLDTKSIENAATKQILPSDNQKATDPTDWSTNCYFFHFLKIHLARVSTEVQL